jgi:ElaA protein
MLNNLQWCTKKFSEVTTNELYDIIKLRIDVFVVEQTCYYPDLDDLDRNPDTLHCFVYSPTDPKTLIAYSRILPKGTTYDEYISIGRVVTSPSYRQHKLGYALMTHTLSVCCFKYPNQAIKISAQAHLEKFYESFGFVRQSEIYLEDNIPHIAMMKPEAK